MAQDSQSPETGRTTAPANPPAAQDDDDGFHYYSGGEVKELEGTKLSPIYLWFITLLLIAAVLYFFFGGTIPGIRSYRPLGGSTEVQGRIRSDLAQRDLQAGGTISNVELAKLPLPDGQTLDQAIDNGSDIYQTYCIGCHGPNQDGNGINAAGLNPKPRNLRDAAFMQSMSFERINQSLHRGVPGTAMPRWENNLNEDQIRDVMAYVWSLTAPKAPATPAAAPATNSYVGGTQNTPTPINVPENGNPAASQSTAPPSTSGANVDTGGTTTVNTAPTGGNESAPATNAPAAAAPGGQISSQTTGPGPQKVAPIPHAPTTPVAGGESPAGPKASSPAPAATH